ncbi:SHOCT domain-containing protein [Chryseobacterium sp. JUb7]|uniref:SHOCT domain-containing protein n=1 Tax=Chryseobacterium sp. JUb7 TaxID=2940599 RepID=UPI00216990CA|nr:SHOCT domain-containing protein [Chryseobacterium sp. JUb7]MCS3528737.1 hypothetical protein [Chryseobacterium sp. JUb7]
MNEYCALCRLELSSMDVLLGENRLADNEILCNKCLEKVSEINQEVLNNLKSFSLDDMKKILSGEFIIKNKEQSSETESVNTEPPKLSEEEYDFRLGQIKNEIAGLNADLGITTRGEIRALPNILFKNEKITDIVEAQFINGGWSGVLMMTESRLIFVVKYLFNDLNKAIIPITDIKFVEVDLTIKLNRLIVHFKNTDIAEFSIYSPEVTNRFCNKLNAGIKPKGIVAVKNENYQPLPKESVDDIFNKLEKLGTLRENGILTEEEFTEQKKKLLGKI